MQNTVDLAFARPGTTRQGPCTTRHDQARRGPFCPILASLVEALLFFTHAERSADDGKRLWCWTLYCRHAQGVTPLADISIQNVGRMLRSFQGFRSFRGRGYNHELLGASERNTCRTFRPSRSLRTSYLSCFRAARGLSTSYLS